VISLDPDLRSAVNEAKSLANGSIRSSGSIM
jgi:hypothetical protein